MAYLLIVEKTGFKNDECGAVEEFQGRKKKKKKACHTFRFQPLGGANVLMYTLGQMSGSSGLRCSALFLCHTFEGLFL